MSDARIVVDVASVQTRRGSPATGKVTLVVGDEFFPSEAWDDFVVVVLTGFAVSIERLNSHVSARERVHFMEGPYAVDLLLSSGDMLEVVAIERGLREHESAHGEVPLVQFAGSLVAACRAVLGTCRSQGLDEADLAELEQALLTLEKWKS